MTSKIIVNNVGADAGITSVHFDSNIQRGISNLHSTGLNVTDTFLHSTGLNLTSDSSINIGVGATISQPAFNSLALGTNSGERLRIGPAGQIGIGGANYGTSGQVLKSRGPLQAPTWGTTGIFESYALLAHIHTANYSVPSNNWETRPLTTELDPFSIVTLDTANDRFSLGAGDYMIKWKETFYDQGDAKSALRKWDGSAYVNADNGETFDIAINQYSNTNHPTQVTTCGVTRTTVPSGQTYTFAIRHHVDDSSSTSSGGRNTDLTTNEIHALVEIYKEVP